MDRTRTIRRGVTTAAVLPLALAGLVAVAPAAGAFPTRTVTETCHSTFNGQALNLRLTMLLQNRNDNDIEKLTVRATDEDASGIFEADDVALRSTRIKVFGDDGDLNVDRITHKWKKGLELDPDDLSEGAEVHRVWARTKYTVDDHIVTQTCYFDFDDNL